MSPQLGAIGSLLAVLGLGGHAPGMTSLQILMPMLLGHVGLAVFNVPLALCFTGHPSLPHSHGSRVLPHDCWLTARLTHLRNTRRGHKLHHKSGFVSVFHLADLHLSKLANICLIFDYDWLVILKIDTWQIADSREAELDYYYCREDHEITFRHFYKFMDCPSKV